MSNSIGNIIKELRLKEGLGINELSRISGVSAGYISALERDEKSNIGIEVLNKLLNVLCKNESDASDIRWRINSIQVFGTDENYDENKYYKQMLGRSQKLDSKKQFTKKDEKDIEKRLENTLSELENQEGLMLSGNPVSEEDFELIKASIKNGLEYAKKMNKIKYTPNKYKK